MKLAVALPVAADVDELDVLSLRGAAERLVGELRTTESEPCLFKRGSCRLSLPAVLDDATGRCPVDTV
jgi:hypothetical protein